MSPVVTPASQSPIVTSNQQDSSDSILFSMSKNRTWSPKEIYDFVWGDLFHYFEEKSTNSKTSKTLIPYILKLLQYIESFTPSSSALFTMKEKMKDIISEIAILRVCEHESSVISNSNNFDLCIEKLKFYGDNLFKSLKKLQQYLNINNNMNNNNNQEVVMSSYLEGDSLLAVFHYTKLIIESYHSPTPSSSMNSMTNQMNNWTLNSTQQQICSNCGRIGHVTSSCNRCSNCTRMHATHLCTQPFPSCGYCHVTKRSSSQRAHITQDCPFLKLDSANFDISISPDISQQQWASPQSKREKKNTFF